jgi:hypothetical protein
MIVHDDTRNSVTSFKHEEEEDNKKQKRESGRGKRGTIYFMRGDSTIFLL